MMEAQSQQSQRSGIRLGAALWAQATSWADFEAAAIRADELGYNHIWTWDHLYAIFGDPYQPIFEGYTTLAAWAKVTTRARLGLLVGANTFRSPAVVAKMLATIDHLSGGRAIGASAARGTSPSIGLRASISGAGSASGWTGWTRLSPPSVRYSPDRPSPRRPVAATSLTSSSSYRRRSRTTSRS